MISRKGGEEKWILWGILALFALLTFFPPRLPLFVDPLTGGYGIPG